MAFLSRAGNILLRTASKHLNQEICVSRPSIFQAVRCMSSSKVFVGGLSYNTGDASLREAFGNYGQVVEARVIVDRETGRSRGFGFVTFTNSLEASSAIQALDGQDLHGCRVRVNYAHDRAGGQGFGGAGNNSGPIGNYGGGDNYGVGGNYGSGGYNSVSYGAGGNYGSAGSSGDGGNQGGGGSFGTGGNFGDDGSLGATGNYEGGIDSYGSGSGGNYNNNFGGSSYGSGGVTSGHNMSGGGNFNSTGNCASHGGVNHQNYGVADGDGKSDNFDSDIDGEFGNNTGLRYTGGDQFGSGNMGNATGGNDHNKPVERNYIDDDDQDDYANRMA